MSGYIASPMSDSKKRRWIRDPLTEEENANGQSYYSDANIEDILQSFEHRSDLDEEQFVRRLEVTALWFVDLAASGAGKPPSTLQRKWGRLAEKLEACITEFDQVGGREQGVLEHAAQQLATRDGQLPDLAPDQIELPTVPGADPSLRYHSSFWPVEKQLERSLASLRWLQRCVAEAASSAGNEKTKPGNRPNEAKHGFYRTLACIYDEAALNPRNPQKGRIDGTFHGEVFEFIATCLHPLGLHDSQRSIYETFYSAGAKLPRAPRNQPSEAVTG